MRFLTAFARFWYDFIIGDDWKIAAAVLVALTASVALLSAGAPTSLLAPATVLFVIAAFVVALVVDVHGG